MLNHFKNTSSSVILRSSILGPIRTFCTSMKETQLYNFNNLQEYKAALSIYTAVVLLITNLKNTHFLFRLSCVVRYISCLSSKGA